MLEKGYNLYMFKEAKGILPKFIDRLLTRDIKTYPLMSEIKTIIEDQLNPPPFVNPQDFLIRPRGVEVGRLASWPDLKLLRWLPTLDDETGLVFQRSIWYIIKSVGSKVPLSPSSEESDICIHSHQNDKLDNFMNEGNFLPSYPDFLTCSNIGRAFIISNRGITRYFPVQDLEARGELEKAVEQIKPGSLLPTLGDYQRLIRRINAKYTLYPWENLSDKTLQELYTGTGSSQLEVEKT